jgi:hypothetical protein
MPKSVLFAGTFHFCRIASLLMVLRLTVPACGQNRSQVRTNGRFLNDTTKIGLPVQYALSSRHPAAAQVIFPDSNFSFAPFEWVDKAFFPTRTDAEGFSTDSAVYTLVTFQTDSIQQLTLPVYVIQNRDCTAVFAPADSIFLKRVLTEGEPAGQVRANTSHMPVPHQANYPLVLGSVVATLLVVLIIYFFFGKRILKRFKLFRMARYHRGFVGDYEKLVRRIRQQVDVSTVANAVVIWKEYMEWLEEKPFSTYTTKEIIEILPDQGLAEALQETDRVIYAQMPSENSFRSVRTLEYIALRRYREKRTMMENSKASEVV